MSKACVISDAHFGHRNIQKYRHFESEEENSETIFDNIMTNMTKRDTLWMNGDMFFTMEAWMKYGVPIAEAIGYTHLVIGNHDSESKERQAVVLQIMKHFTSVHGLVSKSGFWFSHAPIHEMELRGRRNIHGHTHSHIIPDERYFNACCDNINYTPVDLQDIRDGYMGELWIGGQDECI